MTTFHDTNAFENGQKTLHDLWDKAGESNPNVLNPATYKRPTVVSRPKTPLFALLIGINLYHSENLKPLRGAVPDALAFKEYLETDLAIPSENITTLVNGSATRSSIIEALGRLRNDTRISKGDPILIFYAGYGSETQASDTALSTDRCVIPYDYSEKQGHEIATIGHRKIASLVSQIVETKGDNITLIFDCSYAPFTNQEVDDLSTTRVRSARLKSLLPSSGHIETDVWATADEKVQLAEPGHPEKLHPYIFLSACSPSEAARETHGRGNFTKAVLSLLRHSSPHELLNSDLVSRIDQIPGQIPQCVGHSISKVLFDGKVAVTQRTYFHLTNSDSQFVLHAGTIHGITAGAEFTIHSSDDYSFDTPLGQLRVDSLGAFSTTLTFPSPSAPFTVPESALALLAKVGTLEDIRFDNSDLSVGAYYQPPANEEHPSPPLKKNGGPLTIGYGSGGAAPFAYFIRDNQDLDVNFLKLFLATFLVHLLNIPQFTPFETSRSADRFTKSTTDSWSTITSKWLSLFVFLTHGVHTANATPAPTFAPTVSNSKTGTTLDNKISLGIGIGLGIPSLLLALWGVWVAIRAAKGHWRGESDRTPALLQEQAVHEPLMPVPTGGKSMWSFTFTLLSLGVQREG